MSGPVVTASSWVGRTVDGRYRLEERLGTGTFGATYRARHIEHQRIVALKLMHEYVSGDAAQRASFESEAMILARVEHPSIVTLVHYGEHSAQPWIACEWLEGETLAAHMARGPLPLAAALGIVRQLLAALASAHAARLVHRNVKPSNVMLERRSAQARERVKLVDFAPTLHTVTPSIVAGMVSPYSPPEFVAGEPLDARSDVFGVGATLIGLLIGGERDNETATSAPRGLTGMHARALPGIDAGLVAWIRRATSIHPPLRFAHAAEALRELIDLLPRDVRSPSALSEAASGALATVDVRVPRGNTRPVSPLPRLPSMSRSEIPPPPSNQARIEVPRAAAVPGAVPTSSAGDLAAPAPASPAAPPSAPAPEIASEPRVENLDDRDVSDLEPLIPLAARAEAARGTLRPIEKRITSAIAQPRLLPLLAASVFAFLIVAFGLFMHQSSNARPRTSRPASAATARPEPARVTAPARTDPAVASANLTKRTGAATELPKPMAAAPIAERAPPAAVPLEPAPAPLSAKPPSAALPSAVTIVAAPGRPAVRDPWAEPGPTLIERWHELALNGSPGSEGVVKALREYNRDHSNDVRGYLVIGQLYLNRFWRTDCVEEWTTALDRDPTVRGAPELLPALLDMVAQAKVPALARRLISNTYGVEALEPIDRAFGEVRNPEHAARLHALRLEIMESAQGR